MSAKPQIKPQIKLRNPAATQHSLPRPQSFHFSNFEGANSSPQRGWIFLPTLETSKELTGFTARELRKRSRWLNNNTGLAPRLCNGFANLIGYLTPIPITEDEAWNEAVEASWRNRAMQPSVVDSAGKFNLPRLQLALQYLAHVDGFALAVLSKSAGGGARVILYQAHQLETPERQRENPQWVDGVLLNKHNRHVAYGLRHGDKVQVIPATDCLYFGHYARPDHVHPAPLMTPVLTKIHDITELRAAWLKNVKISADLGHAIEKSEGSFEDMAGEALASQVTKETFDAGAGHTPVAPLNADGSAEIESDLYDNPTEVLVEHLYRNGHILNLPPGYKLRTIESANPHPNAQALEERVVREVCWGSADVSPEVMWDMTSARGANNRLLNSQTQRTIANRLLTLRAWMRRFYAYFVACEIREGRLPECQDPHWWEVEFLPQSSITADKGREGKLNIELVANGLRSLATEYGEQGMHWLQQIRAIARERKKLAALGLTPDELLSAYRQSMQDAQQIREEEGEGEEKPELEEEEEGLELESQP